MTAEIGIVDTVSKEKSDFCFLNFNGNRSRTGESGDNKKSGLKYQKNLPFYEKMSDNKINPRNPCIHKKGGFSHEERIKVTRKETREQLQQFMLACELSKLIRHYFPELVSLLKKLPDHRHPSYVTYPGAVILMTRILSSIFYISSMRKTSEEFNSDIVIENIWGLCGEEQPVQELPYWETINRYLEKLEPEGLQNVVCKLVCRLLNSRAFEDMRIRGKHWQIIVDGTQLHSSKKPLDEKCLYRIHKKGKPEEYRENYYYVLEAKLVLHPKILVSIMTEFVENDGKEMDKQDCERKASIRLMEKLKKQFPRLNICLCADSLYACEPFFRKCEDYHWHYLIRFKEGSIPTVGDEFRRLKELEKNRRVTRIKGGYYWHDYVCAIDYNGYKINLVEYGEELKKATKKGKKQIETKEKKMFWFLTDLPVEQKNVAELVQRGRMRWMIENEGFNTQKKKGYHLEHLFSKNYQGIKNHYYLIQIGHMISQVMEIWEKLWEGTRLSRCQKHQRMLESFKMIRLIEYEEFDKKIQVRLQQ